MTALKNMTHKNRQKTIAANVKKHLRYNCLTKNYIKVSKH